MSTQQQQGPDSGKPSDDQTPASAVVDQSASADFAPDPQPSASAPAPQDQVPEKFRGKSMADVIEMYRNSESELGRARNEIGNVRRLADELLGFQRTQVLQAAAQPANPTPRAKLTTDALLEDPERAVLSVIKDDADARERRILEGQARLEAEIGLSKFERKHPTYKQTMDDTKFQEWVQKSPYRIRLAQGALQSDFGAADELFSLYSEVTSVQSTASAVDAADPVDQARKAGLARPGGSSAAGIVPSGPGRKIWNRAELIQMRINEPDKFDSLYPEIELAYREKRVK